MALVGRLMVCFSIALSIWVFGRMLIGNEVEMTDREEIAVRLWHDAQVLQPWYRRAKTQGEVEYRGKMLKELTRSLIAAWEETGVDPFIGLAIARRESSLRPRVGHGKILGSRGEQGYFQVMPGGVIERQYAPDDCQDMTDPLCNARTAFRAMKGIQDRCPGSSPWVWVGVYGRGHSGCPLESNVKQWHEVLLARSYYCTIVEDCDATWPR